VLLWPVNGRSLHLTHNNARMHSTYGKPGFCLKNVPTATWPPVK
jgi:hypothetical protein